MNTMKHCTKWVVPAIVVAFFAAPVSAATCTSALSGNWNSTLTWGLVGCGLLGTPGAGDDVIISNSNTVTIPAGLAAAANSVTIAGGGSNTTLTFAAASSSLAVTNDVVINLPTSNNRTKSITVLTGTLSVGGNVTLNGGTAASRKALLSASTGSITINGGLTINSTVATSSTVQLTSTGTITVNGAAGVTNGDSATIGTGTFNVTNASSTFTNISATNVATISISTGTFNVAGNLTNTTGETITVSSTGRINVGGNWSNGGTFNRGTGTVTFNGTAAQTLGGAATTTFNNLIINKTSGDVTINSASVVLSPTVNATLTLTSGHVITTVGTNDLGLGTAGTVSGGSAASHVAGAVQKNYAAAGTLTFPVGDGTNYTPVVIQGTAGFTAGSLTINTTGGDHPSIASSGIDSTKSVNRYWTLTPTGLPASTYNATFNYINGSPVDFDTGATPANFIVEQWNGTSWFPTTLAGSCTATPATNLCEQITGETGFGDFAIGEPLTGITAVPGLYNAFETTTPAGAILGKIQTKISGTGFSVDVVHVNASKTGVLAGAITVEVRLLDSSGGGAIDTNGCNAAWPLIQALPNFNIPANGRGTIPAATLANSYRSVRFQIRSPVGGPYTQIGCSTDLFAIRPNNLVIIQSDGVSFGVTDSNWQTAGTTRNLNYLAANSGNVHKAGQPFTISATAYNAAVTPAITTNYAGSPDATSLAACVGTACTAAFGTVTLGAWAANPGPAANGKVQTNTASYSEVGAFNLTLQDRNFASVDSVDGTPANCTLSGYYVCSAAVSVGRFVPDHFDVAVLTAPTFKTFNAADAACSTGAAPRRTFTYIGQPFSYATTPAATILARNAAGATTVNYSGSLWKISGTPSSGKDCTTNSNICQFTTSWTGGGNSSSAVEKYAYVLTPGSTPGWDNASAATAAATVTAGTGANIGTGALAISSSTILAFLRSVTTPQAAFTASIADTLSVTDGSESGVAGNGTITTTVPLVFRGTSPDGGITWTGIGWDSGNQFRYGRLKLANAYGSELLKLPVSIQTQYWNGTEFVTNAADNCTTLAAGNIKLSTPPAGVGATMGGVFSSGVGSLTLTKPTTPANVAVNLCVDLGPDPVGGTVCSATSANMPYLQGVWSPGTSYNNDPGARATFGVYKGSNEFIYMREAY